MTQDNNKKASLPEQALNHKPLILVGVAAIVVTIIASSFWLSAKSTSVTADHIDETYTIKHDVDTKVAPAQVTVTPTTEAASLATVEQSPAMVAAQAAFIEEKAKELRERLIAPLMVVNDNNEGNKAVTVAPVEKDKESDPNTRFLQSVAAKGVNSVSAMSIGSLNTIIAQGTLIHATLESAINSDLPGSLRAIVSAPVFSEDATQVLVPRGSRLIGEYKSGMSEGQSRVFIVWSRLITPRGLSLQLGSPSIDSLGMAGLGADSINRHFWERFSSAALLSIIGAGASSVGVGPDDVNNSASMYRSAVANSFSQTASQSLQQNGNIAPTLKITQGKPIMVFVAQDLQFANTNQTSASSFNVF
ncbi:MAG: hypothetical protein A3F13_06815 [Gammaproteobacteria bacterium RIFCSPHIGHO2_12_FULL_40_19]|nr:MAG: hypothetical protein A3F13_06815 [Gammaproteobacteria bacterium RIFCSPHIGHO2_12_FULL_40_19]